MTFSARVATTEPWRAQAERAAARLFYGPTSVEDSEILANPPPPPPSSGPGQPCTVPPPPPPMIEQGGAEGWFAAFEYDVARSSPDVALGIGLMALRGVFVVNCIAEGGIVAQENTRRATPQRIHVGDAIVVVNRALGVACMRQELATATHLQFTVRKMNL